MLRKGFVFIVTCCFCLAMAAMAMAATPGPIDTLPLDQVPAPLPGQHHFLILCMDGWTFNPKNLGNTDGIILLTLDENAKCIRLTSFIREQLVKRPDGKPGRLTFITKNHGIDTLLETLATHYGIKIEKYVLLSWGQVRDMVNAMGGVPLDLTRGDIDYMLGKAGNGGSGIDPSNTTPKLGKAGSYTLNGYAAVRYMRNRYTDGYGDFQRTQRIRNVLSSLAGKLDHLDMASIQGLLSVAMDSTTMTNITLLDGLEALRILGAMETLSLREMRMPADGDATPITYAGMQTQEVDFAASREKLAAFFAQ